MILTIFIYKWPRYILPSFESTGLWVEEKNFEIDFQAGSRGIHLGLSIGIILAIFDLQVTLILATKFPVGWPFGLEKSSN